MPPSIRFEKCTRCIEPGFTNCCQQSARGYFLALPPLHTSFLNPLGNASARKSSGPIKMVPLERQGEPPLKPHCFNGGAPKLSVWSLKAVPLEPKGESNTCHAARAARPLNHQKPTERLKGIPLKGGGEGNSLKLHPSGLKKSLRRVKLHRHNAYFNFS